MEHQEPIAKRYNCPASVKIGFARAQLIAENLKRGIQEITSPDQLDSNPTNDVYDEDVEVAHTLCNSLGMSRDFIESQRPNDVCWGEDYDWSKKQNKVNIFFYSYHVRDFFTNVNFPGF